MSYDLRIAVKVEGAPEDNKFAIIAEPEFNSPTYNIGEMFRKCMNWDFKQGTFYRVAEVYDNIVRGIKELSENETTYRQYNSPNGWGTTTSALKALKSLKQCIDEIVDGWNWNQFPKELLWVAW